MSSEVGRISRSDRPLLRAVKRGFDAVVALAILIVLSPFMLLFALLVRLSSPGPALFRQERVGLNGLSFQLYKFRSMRVSSGGPSVTSAGDKRITSIGRLLRKTKMDELPQLINVLKGDMSLVGPRPEVPRYVERYTPEQREVLTVRPGITGITQLEFRNEEEMLAGKEDVESYYIESVMPAKLELDLRYVRSYDILQDVVILFRTAAVVLR